MWYPLVETVIADMISRGQKRIKRRLFTETTKCQRFNALPRERKRKACAETYAIGVCHSRRAALVKHT